ncbi:MAG: hypothetical protein U0572_02660 [Phycisphaerales bacterium]
MTRSEAARPLALSLAHVVAAALGGLSTQTLCAQCGQTTLYPSGPTPNEQAASSLAIDGATIALGNCNDDSDGAQLDDAGSVTMFRLNNGQWIPDGVLHAPGMEHPQSMGASVALSMPFCLAGAPLYAIETRTDWFPVGAVYVFQRINNAWSQAAILTPPGSLESNFVSEFGAAVALDGEYAVIGAPEKQWDADHYPGLAYVYRRESAGVWMFEDTLPPNDISGWYEQRFGEVVAMERGATSATTFAVVGVPRFDLAGMPNCGEVMVYTKPASGANWGNGWQVLSNDVAAGDGFGAAVDLQGTTMIVGAPQRDRTGVADVGAAYVFVLSANGVDWTQVAKLECPDLVQSAQFGSKVAIDGSTIVISSPQLGRVYVYQKLGTFGVWTHTKTLVDPSPSDDSSDRMGASLGIWGANVVAGDPDNDLPFFPNVGAAHAFAIDVVASNDACAGADVVLAGGTYSGCTLGATSDGGESCAETSNGTPDVWFSFTAPCDGTVTFDTLGSQFDTVLSVHDGCPGTIFNVVACNDDFGPLMTESHLSVGVIAGHGYRVRVAGKSGAVGAFTLNVGPCTPPCPSDLNRDGVVGASDLSLLLGAWGAAADSSADIDHNGTVDSADLAVLLGAWGPCS